MFDLTRTPVLCSQCRASGLNEDGSPCALCGGKGAFARLIIPIKIVATVSLPSLAKPSAFRRLAVLSTEHRPPVTILRGVRDDHAGLVTAMPSARFAEIAHVEFVEAGRSW